jgi:hypothetical protein
MPPARDPVKAAPGPACAEVTSSCLPTTVAVPGAHRSARLLAPTKAPTPAPNSPPSPIEISPAPA